jgi:hypothetical protein
LRAVAWLFVLVGVFGVAEAVVALVQRGAVGIPVQLLGFLVARGLLRHDAAWRTMALIVVWFNIIGCSVFAVVSVVTGSGELLILGWRYESPVATAVMLVGILAVSAWQLRVLTRASVRALFSA